MRHPARRGGPWILLITFLITGYISAARLTQGEGLLPGQIGSFIRMGESEIYTGEDLFLYINGGADLFQEYGFVRVIAGRYGRGEAAAYNAELYEMRDSGGAFGITSLRTDESGESVVLGGAAGKINDYYLNLWKGKYLLTLVAVSRGGTPEEMRKIAGGILAHVPAAESNPPALVSVFEKRFPPAFHLRYLRGELALRNTCPLPGKIPIPFKEGAAGIYGGYKILLFRFPSSRRPGQILRQYDQGLSREGRVRIETRKPGILVISAGGEGFHLAVQDRLIRLLWAPSRKKVEELAGRYPLTGIPEEKISE